MEHAFGTATMAATTAAHDWYDLWYRICGRPRVDHSWPWLHLYSAGWFMVDMVTLNQTSSGCVGNSSLFSTSSTEILYGGVQSRPFVQLSSTLDQKGCPIQKFTMVIHLNLIIQMCWSINHWGVFTHLSPFLRSPAIIRRFEKPPWNKRWPLHKGRWIRKCVQSFPLKY